MFKRLIKKSLQIKHYTLTENLLSAFIGATIALLILLFNYEEIFGAEVRLVDATGYCCGTHGSHGDRLEVGHCAYRPQDYGGVLAIYEALEHDGDYKIGEFITYLEIKDCGYGKPTGVGKSKLIEGKTLGTIETGRQVDVYFPTYNQCVNFMIRTKGKVYIREIQGHG